MESLTNFYDVENQRKNTVDIENSIHNSLLNNKPTIRYNCHDIIQNSCSWLIPLGIVIIMVIIVMVIVVVTVKIIL
jgi:hypothetical protein